jgi:hypothetical protein
VISVFAMRWETAAAWLLLTLSRGMISIDAVDARPQWVRHRFDVTPRITLARQKPEQGRNDRCKRYPSHCFTSPNATDKGTLLPQAESVRLNHFPRQSGLRAFALTHLG